MRIIIFGVVLAAALSLTGCGKDPCLPSGDWTLYGVRKGQFNSNDAGVCLQHVSGSVHFVNDKSANVDLDEGLSTSCSVSSADEPGADGGTACHMNLNCPPCGKGSSACNTFSAAFNFPAPMNGAVLQSYSSELRTDVCTAELDTSFVQAGATP